MKNLTKCLKESHGMGLEVIKAKKKPQHSITLNNLALSEAEGLKRLSVIKE